MGPTTIESSERDLQMGTSNGEPETEPLNETPEKGGPHWDLKCRCQKGPPERRLPDMGGIMGALGLFMRKG